MKELPEYLEPSVVEGLKQHDLLHIIEPEKAVDKDATIKLSETMAQIIASGELDSLVQSKSQFAELSMSRLGYAGDNKLADKIFRELKKRGLARDSKDGKSIPMHPFVRSLVLVLLAQILRPYGDKLESILSPATDRPNLVEAFKEFLTLEAVPVGDVVSFDLAIVGVDLSPFPIDEVLDFRAEHLATHRRYRQSVREFATQLSLLTPLERTSAFQDRQKELDEIAHELRNNARKAWKKPASFGLTIAAATLALAGEGVLAAGAATYGAVLG